MAKRSKAPGSSGDAWFEYTRTAGRITARPVKPIGWIALFGLLTLPLIVNLLLSPWAMRTHVALFVIILLTSLALMFGLLFTLIRAKGREVR